MSRKPIFAQDGKLQQPQGNPTGFEPGRTADTRRKQMKTTELNLQCYEKNQSPFAPLQTSQSQQSIQPNIQERMIKQMQQFEDTFIQKLTLAQTQLVTHQENFQKNYSQSLLKLENQVEQIKVQTLSNENKINKCLQTQTNTGEQSNKDLNNELTLLRKKVNEILERQYTYNEQFSQHLRFQDEIKMNSVLQNQDIANLKTQQKEQFRQVNEQIENLQLQLQSEIRKNSDQIQSIALTFQKDVEQICNSVEIKFKQFEKLQTQDKKSQVGLLYHNSKICFQKEENKIQPPLEDTKCTIDEFEYMYSTQKNTDKNQTSYSIKSEQIENDSELEHKHRLLSDGNNHYSFQQFLQTQSYENPDVAKTEFSSQITPVQVQNYEYVENNFIEEEENEGSPSHRIRTVIYPIKTLIQQESDVVEIGTTKGDNKESFLERISEMRRLPDIPETFELEQSNIDSFALPTQPQNSIQDNFIAYKNNVMTESEVLQQTVPESREETLENEEEVTYQLDENGYLMDENNQYILDEEGQMIQLNQQQIEYLKEQQMASEDE